MNNIFVQIASYRDPQLIPTLKSMIENAKNPKKLIIGICRQYHPDDKFDVLDEYKNDKRFRVTEVFSLAFRVRSGVLDLGITRGFGLRFMA